MQNGHAGHFSWGWYCEVFLGSIISRCVLWFLSVRFRGEGDM